MKKQSLKTRILGFLKYGHFIVFAPIHAFEMIGSAVGSAVLIFGIVGKEDSKFRNFLATGLFYGLALPTIFAKFFLSVMKTDNIIEEAYEDAEESDRRRIQVVTNES